MPTAPLVSIGVPVRNGGVLLPRALAALRAQTYPALRIVVSDNASDDGTAQVLQDAARSDPRVTWSRLDTPVPALENFRRVAIACADAPLFMWAAYDDLWQPDHVELLVAALQARPDAGLAAFDTRVVHLDGSVVQLSTAGRELDVPERVERMRRFVLQDEELGKANLIYGLYRQDVLSAVGHGKIWQDRSLTDYHFLLQILATTGLVVSNGVVFTKTEAEPPPLPSPAHLGELVPAAMRWATGTWRKLGWVRGYEVVLRELTDLSPNDRKALLAAVRRRRRQVLRERAGRPARLARAGRS